MKEFTLGLYKVVWNHTSNTYLVTEEKDLEKIKKLVRKQDDRCDDIISVNAFPLEMFDGDNCEGRQTNSVSMFLELNIL